MARQTVPDAPDADVLVLRFASHKKHFADALAFLMDDRLAARASSRPV